METLIELIIFGAILFLPRIITNTKFDNRIPPDGYRVDHGAINHDFAMGKSKMDIMRKANQGGYDVKK